MSRLEFWFDLASSYSYLAAMRVEELAAREDVEITWRPFLLGPIFKGQGWNTSPFNLYPANGRAVLRDMQRICADRGIPFVMPAQFPAPSPLAVRVAHLGEADGLCPGFTKAAFSAEFGDGKDIADPAVLCDLLFGIGLNAQAIVEQAFGAPVKDRLKSRTSDAQSRGLFGAPTFITVSNELFWGDDRLEQAVGWAKRAG